MLLQDELNRAWMLSYSTVDRALLAPSPAGGDAHEQEHAQTYAALVEEIAALRAERDRLLQLATRDCLTGLWNRRAIFAILEKACAQAGRERGPFAVVLADIDSFKGINDRYGHLAGDVVLRETAQRLSSNIRRTDEVGRYGGEEFLIVLEGCTGRGAAARAEHLRTIVERDPVVVAGECLPVTCSFGVYAVGGSAHESDEIVRRADTALYRAKRAGRNRVVVLDDDAVLAATHA